MTQRFYDLWHAVLNAFNRNRNPFERWMYEAKNIAEEAKRLPILFAMEREGTLPTVHQQCSFSKLEPIEDNHLSCCLGVKCKECEFLKAFNDAGLSPTQADETKSWTCISHIVHKCGKGIIDTSEGYILTVDDRMFWENVIRDSRVDEECE